MATVTYTVKKGDTLSEIAKKFGTTVSKLASLNNIKNVNKIQSGQILIISKDGSSGGGSGTSGGSGTKTTSSKKATITHFDIQKDTDRTVFAAWKWDKSNVENYEVRWYYATGDGIWFVGSDGTTEYKQSTYNAPANAYKVKFKVKPIAKKRKVNGKETAYWKAEWSTEKTYNFSSNPPVKPGTPTVEIKNLKLTASLDDIGELNAKKIEFEIVKITGDKQTRFKIDTVPITRESASYSCTVTAGSEYKVHARSVDGKEKSDWSDYSNIAGTQPATPTRLRSVIALSETSVMLTWTDVKTAESYTIEYTTKKAYFDTNSAEVKSVSGEFETNTAIITGMESGKEYFFRIKATNDDGESGWSELKSIILGEEPGAPTTWSSTTTAIVNEDVILYWVHNSVDGSAQTYAELKLYINGEPIKTQYLMQGSGRFKIDADGKLTTIEEFKDEDDKYNTNSCTIDTSSYTEGIKLEWEIRTAGITKKYGEYSIRREIDIYAKPELEMKLADGLGNELFVVESFPIFVSAIPGPATQTPIGYHISIVANDTYDTVDNIGNEITISKGDEIYSNFFDIKTDLLIQLSADSINLENNMDYTLTCIVSMNSGLTAEESTIFGVIWEEDEYSPDAEIAIDPDTLSAHIRPYCEYYPPSYYQVAHDTATDTYVNTGVKLNIDTEDMTMLDYVTSDGDLVFSATIDGAEVMFVILDPEEAVPVEGVTLAVYRREYDGRFVEIAKGIDHTRSIFVTDPHPALDLARYRIVATTVDTGTVTYTDLPGEPVGESGVIIQWDEKWTNFETTNEDEMEEPPWSGSMLKLPYNIDISDSNQSDVSLIAYVGRSHPVSYYGTHLGTIATWNVEIPKSDKETLYALRRLAIWMGDVYVREPSGSGYWANIAVSFSQKHCELTIPVTLSITRVEGGI